MKLKLFIVLMALGALFSVVGLAGAAGTDAGDAPSAVVLEQNYEFPPVLEGIDVIHDYVIQNKGTAPLTIDNVKTG